MLDAITNHAGNQARSLNAVNVAQSDQMLDFGIKVDNLQFLADLEKSSLWKKISEICLDSRTYSKPPTSLERVLLYYVCDWAESLPDDTLGRPSFFVKLLKQVLAKAPPNLKAELESQEATQPAEAHRPVVTKVVVAANKNQQPTNYYASLFKVRATHKNVREVQDNLKAVLREEPPNQASLAECSRDIDMVLAGLSDIEMMDVLFNQNFDDPSLAEKVFEHKASAEKLQEDLQLVSRGMREKVRQQLGVTAATPANRQDPQHFDYKSMIQIIRSQGLKQWLQLGFAAKKPEPQAAPQRDQPAQAVRAEDSRRMDVDARDQEQLRVSGQLAVEQNLRNRSSVLKNISENESEVMSEKPAPKSTELKFSLDSKVKPPQKILPPKNFSLNAASDSSLEGRSIQLAFKTEPLSKHLHIADHQKEVPADDSNSYDRDLQNLPSSKFTIPVRIGTNKSIEDHPRSLKHEQSTPQPAGQPIPASHIPFFSDAQPHPVRPAEPSAQVVQLLAEKESLLGAIGRQRRELEELQSHLRDKASHPSRHSSVAEQVSELEKELQLLDDHNEAKKMKLQKLRRKLRDKLAAKKSALERVEEAKSQILQATRQNLELSELIAEKKAQVVSASLAMNELMRRTVSSEADVRLLKLVEGPGTQSASPQRLTVYPGEVKLHADYLPHDWSLAKSDEDAIVRTKFLTLRMQGLCYEDERLKVAVKRKPDGSSGVTFVVRLVNCAPGPRRLQAAFLNLDQNLQLGPGPTSADLQPQAHLDLEFRVLQPPLNELPRLQVKASEATARDFLLTHVSLPLALNWHCPAVRLSAQQFEAFWFKGHGHFLQSELREVDRSIAASEADLLALLPAATEYREGGRSASPGAEAVSCCVFGLLLAGRLAAVKVSLTASGLLFLEVLAPSREDEPACLHLVNLYLYALCLFRYSVPQFA